MLPFTPEIGVERPVLKFLITSAQLHVINEARDGDLRMELDVTGTLPQHPGYSGSSTEVLNFSVVKSRWIDQITALGPLVAFAMQVPFPLEDDTGAEPAGICGPLSAHRSKTQSASRLTGSPCRPAQGSTSVAPLRCIGANPPTMTRSGGYQAGWKHTLCRDREAHFVRSMAFSVRAASARRPAYPALGEPFRLKP